MEFSLNWYSIGLLEYPSANVCVPSGKVKFVGDVVIAVGSPINLFTVGVLFNANRPGISLYIGASGHCPPPTAPPYSGIL
jgi:hypothetical protein